MTFILVVLLLLLVPAGLVLIAPRNWVGAIFGWFTLGAGLLYIDDHVNHPAPYDDDFMDVGLGQTVALVCAVSLAIALAVRHKALLARDEDPAPTIVQWARCWSVPIAFLLAAAFLHWLSNRLAGASPAWLIHLLAALPALCLGLMLWGWAQWRLSGLASYYRFLLALPVAFALLVVWQAEKGSEIWSRARLFADGRPYCLMTYGGFEIEREALSEWELSPLVDRRYGVWAIKKAPFLVIATDQGIRMYRWHGGWDNVTNNRPAGCRPRL